MSNKTTGLVAPRYRHFIPVAPALSVSVPALKRSSVSGGLSLMRMYGTVQEREDQYIYHLDDQFRGSTTNMISLYIDGVFIVNNYGFYGTTNPVYNEWGEPKIDPITKNPITTQVLEYDKFDYIDDINAIVLTRRATRPLLGGRVRFETALGPAINESADISMKKYLLQGATQLDLTIDNPRDPNYQFFQGAYRCTLEVLNVPKHGVLSLMDDQLGFVYRPEVGYYGDDKFMYRIINCMGQESPVACITLEVGKKPIINK